LLVVGRFRIVNESKEEFEWIKNSSSLSKEEKLNELVDLRNYLKETYLLKKLAGNDTFKENVSNIINEIDKYWWHLFTKGD